MTEKKAEQSRKRMTIAELAQREKDLMAELARVRVEISERAGQRDE